MQFYAFLTALAIPLFIIAHFAPEIIHAYHVRKRAKRIRKARERRMYAFRGRLVMGEEAMEHLN